MREKNSNLLMMAAYPTYPVLLSSSSSLNDSGPFEMIHQEGEVTKDDGFALLESTGQSPSAAPVWMGASSVLRLRNCMKTLDISYLDTTCGERAPLRSRTRKRRPGRPQNILA